MGKAMKPVAQISGLSDRERLEREREGGGAPSQRPRGDRANLLTRIWRAVMRPTGMHAEHQR